MNDFRNLGLEYETDKVTYHGYNLFSTIYRQIS